MTVSIKCFILKYKMLVLFSMDCEAACGCGCDIVGLCFHNVVVIEL